MAPALAEVVAGGADRLPLIRRELAKSSFVKFAAFDAPAAVEAGTRIRARLLQTAAADRVPSWKHAMKYDAQIAAIAIVRDARAVLTDDRGVAAFLDGSSVGVLGLADLPTASGGASDP